MPFNAYVDTNYNVGSFFIIVCFDCLSISMAQILNNIEMRKVLGEVPGIYSMCRSVFSDMQDCTIFFIISFSFDRVHSSFLGDTNWHCLLLAYANYISLHC